MSTVLAQAQIILTADTARFTQEITNARNLSVNSFDDIQRSAKEMAKVGIMGVVAGATAATTAIAAMTVEQVKLANELAKTAQVANTSVTAIQKYTFAAKAAGIELVAFDRSGFRYHGRVKALAEAAREAGLKF